MTTRSSWCTALIPIVFLSVAGCAGDQLVVYTPETPAERELRESRENLQRTVGEGGLVGAGAGALVGGAVGGLQGAFSGAQVGRFGGAAAGGYVRQLQEEYASQEQVLNAVVADLKTTNARMDQSIKAMQAVLQERQNSVETSAARDERLEIEVTETLETAKQQEAFFVNTRSLLISDGMSTGTTIDPELSRLRSRVTSMQKIANTLAGV